MGIDSGLMNVLEFYGKKTVQVVSDNCAFIQFEDSDIITYFDRRGLVVKDPISGCGTPATYCVEFKDGKAVGAYSSLNPMFAHDRYLEVLQSVKHPKDILIQVALNVSNRQSNFMKLLEECVVFYKLLLLEDKMSDYVNNLYDSFGEHNTKCPSLKWGMDILFRIHTEAFLNRCFGNVIEGIPNVGKTIKCIWQKNNVEELFAWCCGSIILYNAELVLNSVHEIRDYIRCELLKDTGSFSMLVFEQ